LPEAPHRPESEHDPLLSTSTGTAGHRNGGWNPRQASGSAGQERAPGPPLGLAVRPGMRGDHPLRESARVWPRLTRHSAVPPCRLGPVSIEMQDVPAGSRHGEKSSPRAMETPRQHRHPHRAQRHRVRLRRSAGSTHPAARHAGCGAYLRAPHAGACAPRGPRPLMGKLDRSATCRICSARCVGRTRAL
jgi:hypothetical protein